MDEMMTKTHVVLALRLVNVDVLSVISIEVICA